MVSLLSQVGRPQELLLLLAWVHQRLQAASQRAVDVDMLLKDFA